MDLPPRIMPPAILRPSSANRHFPYFPAPTPAVRLITSDGPDRIPAPIPPSQTAGEQQTKEKEKVKMEAPEREIKMETISQTLPTDLKNAQKGKKSKPPKNKRFVSDGTIDGDPNNAGNCRYDSSLGLLTKKFLNLLQRAEDGTLDLNKAAETLEVQKRRIYDITNVLEGVDLIEKKLKNMIRWKGYDMSRPKQIEEQINSLKSELDSRRMEEIQLDGMIRDMKDNLQEFSLDENNQRWLFLSKEDINNIPCLQNSTLIAIKAPHGTSLEVPDPDEGLEIQRHYQILMRSSTGPVGCYLISNNEERPETSYQNNMPSEEDNNNKVAFKGCSYPYISSDDNNYVDGVMRITPSNDNMDADYWLSSDLGVSITETWGT